MHYLFADWFGGVLFGSSVTLVCFLATFVAAWRDIRILRARLAKADAVILGLHENGWTTPEEDDRKLAKLAAKEARPRGKDGRFLSRDAAARAAGIPVDFARAMRVMEQVVEKRRARERGEAPWGRDIGGAPLGPPRLARYGHWQIGETATSVREAFAIVRRGQEERDRALGDAIDGHFVPEKKRRRG